MRPVISSINCHTSKISEYVDYDLQPIVREIPSKVKDTSDSLQEINAVEFVPENSYLVSLDVKYTSIPDAEGVKTVKKLLDNYLKRTVATKVIRAFLALMLTLNNFMFNSTNYLQTRGCAMGTICAPSYANIFMDHFEKKTYIPIYHRILINLSQIYWRHIFIWTGSKKDLMKFLNELHTKHESIKFEYQISKTSIIFLDTEVCIKNNKLYTKIYRKKQIVKHSSTSTLNTLNLWRPVLPLEFHL